MRTSRTRSARLLSILPALMVATLPVSAGTIYVQTNLVSDIPGLAAITDANLVNPWGLSASATSPWWVSDNGTGVSTLYNGNTGAPQALVVTIPPPAGASPPSSPTGQVFNSTASDFKVNSAKSNFIFATESGTIAAWRGALGTNAATVVDNSASGAVYKGLALGSSGGLNFLYAANFNSGNIDVFNGNFSAVASPGFVDPGLPAGYAPFNVQNLGGLLYVTYALQDASRHDDVAGAGNGYVDVFDTNGTLLRRLGSNGALNSPWGLALASSGFGDFSGDLLVGNFGDGTINVFDPHATNSYLGTLLGPNGIPVTIEGLWGLGFGNGAASGSLNSLYFTAGISGGGAVEDHGLFGSIHAAPEPGTLLIAPIGLGLILLFRRKIACDGRAST